MKNYLQMLVLAFFLSLVVMSCSDDDSDDIFKPVWGASSTISAVTQQNEILFYSFENGEVARLSHSGWDIMMTPKTRTIGAAIRISNNVKLWEIPNYVIEEFPKDISADDQTAWVQNLNSYDRWANGAFNQNSDNANFDYGWGVYDAETNIVNAKRVYVLEYAGKKIQMIIRKLSVEGVYFLEWADLDGTNTDGADVATADYSTKDFIGYNFTTKEIVDYRPPMNAWDLEFSANNDWAGPSAYPIGMVLTNFDDKTAEINEIADVVNYVELPADEDYLVGAGVIGADWKAFDQANNVYTIVSDRVYFASSPSDVKSVYKIIFTSFGAGTYGFTQQKVTISE